MLRWPTPVATWQPGWIELDDVQEIQERQGKGLRVSGTTVKECGWTWVSVEEWEVVEGRKTDSGLSPWNHSLQCSCPEPHEVSPLDYIQLATCSFFPQVENVAEYIISLAGCKWAWIRTRPKLTLSPDLCLLLQDLDDCQTTRTQCRTGTQ